MKRIPSAIIAISLVSGMMTTLLRAENRAPISIVRHIEAGMIHKIQMPDSVLQLLNPTFATTLQDSEPADDSNDERTATPGSVNGKAVGYRVQIFSDNNPRTAKNEARSKQRAVSSQFPAYRTYVSFNSPYWRLKVGDFRTQTEANEAAEELRRAFPANAKEIRVVRDRINITN